MKRFLLFSTLVLIGFTAISTRYTDNLQAPQNPYALHSTVDTIQWKYINTFDETIAYSRIAELGKVSVFVLSTPWCGSCKTLKKQLSTHTEYQQDVDFYYINMCSSCSPNDFKRLQAEDAYAYARLYDRLKEWPRIIITSPSTSIIKNFSKKDLARECYERSLNQLYKNRDEIDIAFKDLSIDECQQKNWVYHKTLEIVNRLLKHKRYFHSDKVITAFNPSLPLSSSPNPLPESPAPHHTTPPSSSNTQLTQHTPSQPKTIAKPPTPETPIVKDSLPSDSTLAPSTNKSDTLNSENVKRKDTHGKSHKKDPNSEKQNKRRNKR